MIARGRPFRILLADDDHMCRSVNAYLLEACGYEVVAVADGRAAVAAAAREPFALVLMDIMMPEMDGYEAVALIRERERPGDARLPVVALTGFSVRADRRASWRRASTTACPNPPTWKRFERRSNAMRGPSRRTPGRLPDRMNDGPRVRYAEALDTPDGPDSAAGRLPGGLANHVRRRDSPREATSPPGAEARLGKGEAPRSTRGGSAAILEPMRYSGAHDGCLESDRRT